MSQWTQDLHLIFHFWAMRGPAVAEEARFLEMKNEK
jgi:hypothetical protein